MGKLSPKNKVNRRKHPRSAAAKKKAPDRQSTENAKTLTHLPLTKQDEMSVDPTHCSFCGTNLIDSEKALYVEEEVGRTFCSEACITSYFGPEIEKLEKEFYKRLSPSDLNDQDREKVAHLRWVTLQEPDEVWRQKTLHGDYRYTLISEFKPGTYSVWCICICLFLRGEPSFLYLAIPTKNASLVEYYRKGERIQWAKPKNQQSTEVPLKSSNPPSDSLALEWTEDESRRAKHVNFSTSEKHKGHDIDPDQHSVFEKCLEPTLQSPDEVWSHPLDKTEDSLKVYHFIKEFDPQALESLIPEIKGTATGGSLSNKLSSIWYVIQAKESEEEDGQLEIIEAFPTIDPSVLKNYRTGTQEINESSPVQASKLIH